MRKICKTCRHAYGRSSFDILRNGEQDKPIACWLKKKKLKKAYETCDSWKGHTWQR